LDEDFIESKEPVKKETKKQTKVTLDWGEEENENASNVRKIKDIKYNMLIAVKSNKSLKNRFCIKLWSNGAKKKLWILEGVSKTKSQRNQKKMIK
jgi:hypothetical protein